MNGLDLFYYCWIVAFFIVQFTGIHYARKIELKGFEHLDAGLMTEFMENRKLVRSYALMLAFHMIAFIGGAGIQIWYEHWWLGL